MNSESPDISIVSWAQVDAPINWKTTFLFTAGISFLIWFGMYSGLGLYILIGILGILGMVMILRNPFLWICAVFVGYIPIFWKATSSFTVTEVAHAVIFYGGLLWWFFRRNCVPLVASVVIIWSLAYVISGGGKTIFMGFMNRFMEAGKRNLPSNGD